MKILIDGQTLYTPEINRGIGRCFINVIERMLENNFTDEFYINLADKNGLETFSNFAKVKLRPIINDYFHPTKSTNAKYTKALNADLEKYNIDLYWNPNPLMVNVFLPERHSETKFTATIFDLIPLIMKKTYLDQWPPEMTKNYFKKLEIFQRDYALFLHISKNTKKDFLKHVKASKAFNVVTPLAADDIFVPDPFPKIVSTEKYILYTGGFDPRKNMLNAIKAFSILQSKYKNKIDINEIKLFIVCAVDENSKNELMKLAKSFHVDQKVMLTGYISDRDLLTKYQKARAFFFPSLYEGFGLPIVEALACGVPVACSDNSSLSEIGQKQVHYFSAFDVNTMAQALFSALNDSTDFTSRMKRYQYAQQFTWKKTAQLTITAFHDLIDPKIKSSSNNKKEMIAWLSPLPPQQSGIANYSYRILQELKKKANIHLYYDGIKPTASIQKQFRVYPISEFKEKYNNYQKVYYHIGNSPQYHTNIYKLAWHLPGIVILHDYNIQTFLDHAFLRSNEKSYFYDSLTEGYKLSPRHVLLKTWREWMLACGNTRCVML